MILQEQRLAANHIRIADRIIRERGGFLESNIKEK
jgi:hypothetical protein